MTNTYQSRFTWDNGFIIPGTSSIEAIEHTDGSVSVAFVWEGFSTELSSSGAAASAFQSYATALSDIDNTDITFENHFLREFDSHVVDEYVEFGKKKTTRFHELSEFVRNEMASMVGNMAMENTIVTVATMSKRSSPFAQMFPKRQLKQFRNQAKELYETVHEFSQNLPGSRFLSYREMEAFIWRLYHRERARAGSLPSPNPRFRLADRVAEKPEWKHGLIKVGNTYTKVCLLLDYADADPNWFYSIANRYNVEIHVTQLFKVTNAGVELMRSASQEDKAKESAVKTGGEGEKGKVKDHDAFRNFVSDNNLSIFDNAYIIKLHHTDHEELKNSFREFKKVLGDNTVISSNLKEVCFLYWRISQFGQGHRSPFMRPDHSLQVANMAPVIQFNEGNTEYRQMLRITSDAKAITLAYPPDGTGHQITAAKTMSGKGVENVAKILELYPLGTNFYITEVGSSYKWTVEAFGGQYHHLDPNNTVISPFPDFKLADTSNKSHPLPSDIVAPTIGALSPLLARGANEELGHHIDSVAEQIMQAMYALTEEKVSAPSLANFYTWADQAKSEFSGVHSKAVHHICDNLHSFLSSTAGSNFVNADSLNFDAGIVGVDFKALMGNEELAKFLLVFITLRFKQLAFANATPTRILIDELHEFERIDPVLILTLIKQLTRMGRKEAGAYHGISQEVMDSAMEPGILNQVTHREFMYLQSGHNAAADLYKINDRALQRWKGFSDPEAAGSNMDYRQCLRMVGEDTFDLHLKFPQSLLDLAHSSPTALAAKKVIGEQANDVFERLRLFREAMSQ